MFEPTNHFNSFQLFSLTNPQRGARYCCSGLVILGREIENSIHLPHPSVSRLHAMISHDGRQHVIFDVGSLTGTWLNGIRITAPQPLLNGDIISLGSRTHLVFVLRSHRNFMQATHHPDTHQICHLQTAAEIPLYEEGSPLKH